MTATIINKVKLKDIKAVSITAKRWTDSYGNTYHSVYLSALASREISNAGFSDTNDIDLDWMDLASESFTYGYDRQYDQTALELFKQVVEGVNLEGKDFIAYLSTACRGLSIAFTENVYDVKRKKDL